MVLTETEQLGSISHGTLRNEDLIPKYMSVIFKNNPKKAHEIWQSSPNLLQALCDKEVGQDNPWWHSNEACEIAEELMNTLQEYAPEGHYFGSHLGNDSDIGYWEDSTY